MNNDQSPNKPITEMTDQELTHLYNQVLLTIGETTLSMDLMKLDAFQLITELKRRTDNSKSP